MSRTALRLAVVTGAAAAGAAVAALLALVLSVAAFVRSGRTP